MGALPRGEDRLAEYTVPDFYPIDYIPRGVRLTTNSGGASDLPSDVLQDFLAAVGKMVVRT